MKKSFSCVAARIVDSAVELFKRDGFENVSVNAICKHAQINRSSFYNIFECKDSIITYLLDINSHNTPDIMQDFINAPNDFERMWLLCSHHLTITEKLGPELASAVLRVNLIKDTNYLRSQAEINRWCIKLYENCLNLGIARSYAAPEELVPLATAAAFSIVYDWCKAKGAFPLFKTVRHAVEVLYGIRPEFCRSEAM